MMQWIAYGLVMLGMYIVQFHTYVGYLIVLAGIGALVPATKGSDRSELNKGLGVAVVAGAVCLFLGLQVLAALAVLAGAVPWVVHVSRSR